jgi:hypothetical protein
MAMQEVDSIFRDDFEIGDDEKIVESDFANCVEEYLIPEDEILTMRVNKIIEKRLREKHEKRIAQIRRFGEIRIAKVQKDLIQRTRIIQQFVQRRIEQEEEQLRASMKRNKF